MPPLEYASPKTEQPSWVGAGVLPLLLLLPPAVGYVFQIGYLYVFGGFATFFGVVWGIVGLWINVRKPGMGLWVLSIALNAWVAWYFYHLFFIEGLC